MRKFPTGAGPNNFAGTATFYFLPFTTTWFTKFRARPFFLTTGWWLLSISCVLQVLSLVLPLNRTILQFGLSRRCITMATSSSDTIILALGVVLAAVYVFRDQLFSSGKPKNAPLTTTKPANGSGNPRDFIAKMKESVRRFLYSGVLCL